MCLFVNIQQVFFNFLFVSSAKKGILWIAKKESQIAILDAR